MNRSLLPILSKVIDLATLVSVPEDGGFGYVWLYDIMARGDGGDTRSLGLMSGNEETGGQRKSSLISVGARGIDQRAIDRVVDWSVEC